MTSQFIPPPEHNESPLDIECPVCHAQPGDTCDLTGTYIRAVEMIHHERIDTYFGGVPTDEQLAFAVGNAVDSKLF